MIEEKLNFDLCNREYTEYTIPNNYGTISFSATPLPCNENDFGYILFDVNLKGEPSNIQSYFGMNREQVREFATKLLEITEK